jgi:chromate transport protein ChrA
MLWVGLRYCWLTITGQTDPVFAGWLVLTVSVGIAFWTYQTTSNHSLVNNIGNTVDLVVGLMIITTISIFGQNVRAGFTWFETSNLTVAGVVLIFWWRSKNPFTSNLAIQALMVIGYLPLIARILTVEHNPEPWSVWIPSWFACVFAMVPAYLPKKTKEGEGDAAQTWRDTFLPKVYATRAFVFVTTLLLLMLWAELN